ncbi:MAG: hypothetical protein R6U94_09970 [Nitriliruptoraceae bacterium]
MTSPAGPEYDHRVLLLATAVAMAAIVALPLTAAADPAVAAALSLATPVVLLLAGRLRGQRWMVLVGTALLVALAGLLAADLAGVGIGPLAGLVVAVVLVGPVVAVLAVGLPLREVDMVAGGAFLITATIAVISGFAAAGTTGATALILGVALVGFTAVAFRLGRTAPDEQDRR